MKRKGQLLIYLIVLALFAIAFSARGTVSNSGQETLIKNSQVGIEQQDTSESVDRQNLKDKMMVHVENDKGQVEIIDDNLAELLINNVGKIEGKPQVFSSKDFQNIAAACPFDNEVMISKNDEELCRFWITGDSCNTVLKQDYSVIEISHDVYNELEKVMKKKHNSLHEYKRYNL